MPAFDPRGANEAGFPWEPDYARIRPEYFDLADRRIFQLVEQGLMPCMVGAWGYHLPWLGEEKMKQHWRYLIARWGALPVVWCAAGEGTMPFYLSQDGAAAGERQRQGWTEVIRCLRETDPFDRLVTIHPSRTAPRVGHRSGRAGFRHAADGPRRAGGAPRGVGPGGMEHRAGDARDLRRVAVRGPGNRPQAGRRRRPPGVLDASAGQRRGRRHVRGQRNLASQPPRAALRKLARRKQLGHHALGRRNAVAGIGSSGLRQTVL